MILWLVSCAAPPAPPADPSAGPPDVVIVSVDTLRADRLGFAGQPAAHTPALDALAASGHVFEQATTPFPRTTPALSSLQTGLWPHHHGSREVGQPMTADQTLATRLRAGGWQTLAISAIRVASPEQHLDRGFDRFEVLHDLPAPQVTAAALSAVDALGADRPAYLWVHYSDPHFPYLPDPSGPLQPEAPRCRELGRQAASGALRREQLFSNRDGLAASVLEECVALYDAEVAVVDAAVGALLDGLGQRRGGRPRYVVLTADHGESHGEGGLFFEHGPDVGDACLRVPLVIAGPGIDPGRDAGVARLEDVAPTLLEAVGLPVPDGLDGLPLGARLRGGSGGAPAALAESGSALHPPLFGYLVSGRSRRWCVNDEVWSWCFLGPKLGAGLFDHRADPELKHDRQDEQPEIAARLRAAAERWKPEQARERTVRTATRKLVSTPVLDGGRRLALYAVDAHGSSTPVDDPEALAALTSVLDGFSAALDAPPGTADRTDEQLEALRSLGYVE